MNELKEMKMERLRQYLNAEQAILSGAQEYTIGDRQLRRADLKYIQSQIADLLVELQAADSTRGRTKRAVFVN